MTEYYTSEGEGTTQVSRYGSPGQTEEYYITVSIPRKVTFKEELDALGATYHSACDMWGLAPETQIFARFYLSDIANQKDSLRASELFRHLRQGAVSTIQQCPVFGGNITLLAYHITHPGRSLTKDVFIFDEENRRNGVLVTGDSYRMLWTANFCGKGPLDSYTQTTELFTALDSVLNDSGMALLNNMLRTWIYVRDVDNNYVGMVVGRKDLFEARGLTPASRYIASTGIEGFSKEVNSLVALDSVSMSPLDKAQIVSMCAPGNMPPTISYGVTFERGTRIRFGDRSHLLISGTASIDAQGNVMYPGDVLLQTERTIDNITSLLESQGAGLSDLAYGIAYIRNIKDGPAVMEVIRRRIPEHMPVLLLIGSVCRPAWLVEIEGVAIIPDRNEFPEFL